MTSYWRVYVLSVTGVSRIHRMSRALSPVFLFSSGLCFFVSRRLRPSVPAVSRLHSVVVRGFHRRTTAIPPAVNLVNPSV